MRKKAPHPLASHPNGVGIVASKRISETNGKSVVSGRRLTGFLAGLRRRIRVLCQPRSENCPGLPIFFGEAGKTDAGGAAGDQDGAISQVHESPFIYMGIELW